MGMRRRWLLLIMAFLLCGEMAAGARLEPPLSGSHGAASASPLTILYSQPPSLAGGLLHSSLRDPEGSATDQWAWDGFMLGSTHAITEVRWRGGYDPVRLGSGGPVADFTVSFYASIPSGIQPDISKPPLVHYEVGGNASETPAGVLGGVQTYDYNYTLPVPFQAAAGTKYWLQIEAYQPGAPDWGLAAATGGDGQYFRRLAGDGYNYQIARGDAAFALVGPGMDGYVLYLPGVSRTHNQVRLHDQTRANEERNAPNE